MEDEAQQYIEMIRVRACTRPRDTPALPIQIQWRMLHTRLTLHPMLHIYPL